MNHLEAAHLRILESIPRERVRTVAWKERESDKGGRKPLAETLAMHARIVALHARGLKNYEIADELDISRVTVGRHVNGKVRAVKR